MNRERFVIACDAGATKTDVALFRIDGSSPQVIFEKTFQSRNYDTPEIILKEFLSQITNDVDAVCIGVPGPVKARRSETTNIPWVIDESELTHELGIENCILVNDMEILAHAIPLLSVNDVTFIHGTKEFHNAGNRAVIAPGTGLGQVLMIECGDSRRIVPTEGGHADFAPQSKLQFELYEYLASLYGHVSIERVLSGQGICDIYDFLSVFMKKEVVELVTEPGKEFDKANLISITSAGDPSGISRQAMELFAEILGAHCGNIALTINARGGIFLGGGIPAKNAELLSGGSFLKSYLRKGRLRSYVADCPVCIIRYTKPGLLGAAVAAMSLPDERQERF